MSSAQQQQYCIDFGGSADLKETIPMHILRAGQVTGCKVCVNLQRNLFPKQYDVLA